MEGLASCGEDVGDELEVFQSGEVHGDHQGRADKSKECSGITGSRPTTTGRVLMERFSESAERAVIGAAVRGSGAIPALISRLSPRHFYIHRNNEIWQFVHEICISGGRPDLITLNEQLTRAGKINAIGGAAYLMELADESFSDVGLDGYVEIIIQHYVARQAERMARESLCAAQEGASALELVQMATQAASSLTEAASANGGVIEKPSDMLVRILTNDRPPRLITGFKFLDDRIQIRPGNLVVIGATPGSGKTSLALGIAFQSAIAKNVLFDSLEMSIEELTENMMAFKTGIKLDRIANRLLSNEEMEECAGVVRSRGDRLRIVSCPTVASLAAKARAMKQNGGLELIVVDYLQLMDGPGSGDVERISNVSRALKMLAQELMVPVIALSQFSREGAIGGRPLLRHLRGSGSIEQDANIVVFLWPDPEGSTDRMITVAKNRRGALSETTAGFDGSIVRFYDIPV